MPTNVQEVQKKSNDEKPPPSPVKKQSKTPKIPTKDLNDQKDKQSPVKKTPNISVEKKTEKKPPESPVKQPPKTPKKNTDIEIASSAENFKTTAKKIKSPKKKNPEVETLKEPIADNLVEYLPPLNVEASSARDVFKFYQMLPDNVMVDLENSTKQFQSKIETLQKEDWSQG